MGSKFRKVFGYFASTVKSGDLYGKKIMMTYKGEDSFKTVYGGVISLFIKLALFIYAILLISVILNKGDTKKTVNTTTKDTTNDNTKHYIGRSTFGFGFSFEDYQNGNNLLMDNTYFEFKIENEFYSRDLDGNVNITTSPIPYEYCGQNFQYVNDQNRYDIIRLDKFVCPISDDYYISSHFYGAQSAFIQIYIK